jgi:hypothetical protein
VLTIATVWPNCPGFEASRITRSCGVIAVSHCIRQVARDVLYAEPTNVGRYTECENLTSSPPGHKKRSSLSFQPANPARTRHRPSAPSVR